MQWSAIHYRTGLEVGQLFKAQLNVSSLKQLQALPFEAFENAAWPPSQWANGLTSVPYFTDHGILTDEPARLIANLTHTVPVILNANHWDAGADMFLMERGQKAATQGTRISVVGSLPANASQYHTSFVKELAAFVGTRVAREAVSRYSFERFGGDATQAAGKLIADLVIMCPTWKLASALARYDSPVWAHDFNGVHRADVNLFFNTAHFFCPTCLQLNSRMSTEIANTMERW